MPKHSTEGDGLLVSEEETLCKAKPGVKPPSSTLQHILATTISTASTRQAAGTKHGRQTGLNAGPTKPAADNRKGASSGTAHAVLHTVTSFAPAVCETLSAVPLLASLAAS